MITLLLATTINVYFWRCKVIDTPTQVITECICRTGDCRRIPPPKRETRAA